MLDVLLMRWVVLGSIFEGLGHATRVRCDAVAKWLTNHSGHLWVKGSRWVTLIWERKILIRQEATSLGLLHGSRVYPLLLDLNYWPGMAGDVLWVYTSAISVQVEGALFKQPKYLVPTYKDLAPFAVWCIDLVGKMNPPAADSTRYLVVCICVFSIWVEMGFLQTKRATEVARWFHLNITYRFGVPLAVQSDCSGELSAPLLPTCGLLMWRTSLFLWPTRRPVASWKGTTAA